MFFTFQTINCLFRIPFFFNLASNGPCFLKNVSENWKHIEKKINGSDLWSPTQSSDLLSSPATVIYLTHQRDTPAGVLPA